MATQVQEQGLGPPNSAAAAGCTQDNVVPSSQTNQAAQPASTVTAGLGLVHKHCSFCDQMPKPTLSGQGIVFSLSPGNTPPPSWAGMSRVPRSPVSCQHDSGVTSPDGSQKPIAPSIFYFFLSPESRRGLMTDAHPALESSLPLGSINTLISHTEPSQVSPCSSSPSYQRTSVSSRPVLYHS